MADPKAKLPRHRVLYIKQGRDLKPVFSCAHDDPNGREDIAAERVRQINLATNAGAPRPDFVVRVEENGEEVSSNG